MAQRLMLSIRRARDQIPECFLFAGSSALLLSLAHVRSEFWFVSLFALVPFLWRAVKASLSESIVLGGLLAISYSLVTVPVALWVSPDGLPLKLLVLGTLFTLYAVGVSRASMCFGFNAVLIAFLWLPVEYVLSHYAHLGDIFALSEVNSSLFIRIGSLFGMLIVSFAVVLVNSLLIVALECVVRVPSASARFSDQGKRRPDPATEIVVCLLHLQLPCVPRAPPVPSP